MTSAKYSDFLPPSPLVTVTLTQLISTVVCFWGTPLPAPNADIICTCPFSHLCSVSLFACLSSISRVPLPTARKRREESSSFLCIERERDGLGEEWQKRAWKTRMLGGAYRVCRKNATPKTSIDRMRTRWSWSAGSNFLAHLRFSREEQSHYRTAVGRLLQRRFLQRGTQTTALG